MRNMKGFSLIELLVVVAIIGVLAAAGVVGYQNYTQTAKENVAKNNFANVLRYVRNQAGVKASGIETGTCASTLVSTCSAASAPDMFVTYFDTNGFDNPFNAASSAVITLASGGTSTVDCSETTNTDSSAGLVEIQEGSNQLTVIGCEGFDSSTSVSHTVTWE